MLLRDGVRGEGEKEVGSIHAIRCKIGKESNEVGCEIRNIEEAVHFASVDDGHKVIRIEEGTKRTLISFNTSSSAFHTISSSMHAGVPRNCAVRGISAEWHVGSFLLFKERGGCCMGTWGHERCICFEGNSKGAMRDAC